jgi:hypothetical protein
MQGLPYPRVPEVKNYFLVLKMVVNIISIPPIKIAIATLMIFWVIRIAFGADSAA